MSLLAFKKNNGYDYVPGKTAVPIPEQCPLQFKFFCSCYPKDFFPHLQVRYTDGSGPRVLGFLSKILPYQ
jgi:hypothetical protein